MGVRALALAAMLAGLVVAFTPGGVALRSRVLAGRQAAAPADLEPRMVSHSQRRRRKAAREAKAARELLTQTAAPPVRRPSHRRRTHATFASTSALVMMLILALGSIGVVQGMWSKNLTFTGTVETGDLNADWVQIITSDQPGQPNTATISTEVLPSCDATIGGVGSDSEFGNQVAYVVITEATPAYWCEIKAFVSNTGSVPFNIIGINGVLDAPNDEGLSFEDLNGIGPSVCELIDEFGNSTTERTVDPGEEGIVHCKVLVDSSAEYGWTYHFAVEVCVAQWNEDPSTGGESADFDACKHPSSGTHEGPDTPVLPAPGPTT